MENSNANNEYFKVIQCICVASDFDMTILLIISGLVFTALAYPLCDSSCNSSNVTCGKVMIFLTTVFLILCGVDANVKNGGLKHNCQNGTILPREPMFVEGQNLTLVCNSKTGRWKRMKFVRGSDAEELPVEYISKINKTAIQLAFPVTETEIKSHNKSMQYRCIQRIKKKNICIDNVYVQLDFKPQPPTDVQCRLYDFSSINCTWSLGVKYVHRVDVKCQYIQDYYDSGGDVDFRYKSDNPNAIWQPCPHQTGNSCIWANEDFTDPLVLYVRLTVSNSRNKMESSPIRRQFNKYNIIVPGPVEKLVVYKTKNPRCVTLDWTPSKAGSGRDFVYNVEYQSDCSQAKSIEITYDGIKKSLEPFEICGLNPYTVYTFYVRGKILAEKKYDNTTIIPKGLWSRSVNTSDRTESDVIDVNPQTNPGLYEIDTDKSMEKEGYATVRIYWKPLPDCEQHANHIDVCYDILAFNISKHSTVEKFFEQISIPRHHDKINLSLHASNSIGGPNVSEVVTVFPTHEGPTPSDLVVMYNDTNSDCKMFATISPKDSKPVNHTVVWCKGTVNCQEPIQWQALQVNQTLYEFPKDVCTDVAYRFGLITHGYRDNLGLVTNTGIHWEKCFYQIGKVPTEVLPDVVAIPGTRLEVQWSEYDCDKIKTYVIQYDVSFCETSDKDCKCPGKVTVITRPRNATKFIDDSLPDNARVCVWVTPMTSSGSAPSHPLFVELKSEVEESGTIILEVIAIVGGIILFFAPIGGCVVWYRKRRKRLIEANRVNVDETNAPALDNLVLPPEQVEMGETTPPYRTNSLVQESSGFHTAGYSDASECHSLLGNSYPAALNGYKQTKGIFINSSDRSDEDSVSGSSYEEDDNNSDHQINSSVSSFSNIGNKADAMEADMQEIDDQVDCDDESQVSVYLIIKPSYKDESIELSASADDDEHLDEVSQVDNQANVETVIANDELDSEIDTANDTSCAIFPDSSGDLNGIYNNPNDIIQDSGSLQIGEIEENLEGNYQSGVDDSGNIVESIDSNEENCIKDNDDDIQTESIDEYAKCTAGTNELDKIHKTKNGLNGILPGKNGIKQRNGLCKSIIEVPDHSKQALQS